MNTVLYGIATSATVFVLFALGRTLKLIRARARYERAETALESWQMGHIGKYPFAPDAQLAIREKLDALAAYRREQARAPRLVRFVLTDDPDRLERQSKQLERMLT